MKRADENLCTHGGDMLAYLYDEMTPADRERFDLHLSDCGTCIDDFAELSQSRYPVYEWKQTEFDPLSTPQVVIPYREATASWFDKFRAALAFTPRFALGGAAGLILAGVVTAYVFLSGSPVNDLAQKAKPSPSPSRTAAVLPPARPSDPEASETTTAQTSKRPSAPQPAKVNTRSKSPAKMVKSDVKPTPKKNDTVPVYSTVEDEQDDSLRLSDIFAELDTSD